MMKLRQAAAAAAAVAILAAPAGAGDGQAILERIEEHYRDAASLRVAFTERYVSEATGRALEESGEVLVKRPGKMRWEYHGEEPKLFVMRDGLAWFYVPDELVVYRMRTTGRSARRMPALFLTGESSLAEEFTAERVAPAGAAADDDDELVHLRLTPRGGDDELDHVLVDVRAADASLVRVAVVDPLGNATEFRFAEERLNVRVARDAFEFEIPRDVDLVDVDDG